MTFDEYSDQCDGDRFTCDCPAFGLKNDNLLGHYPKNG
jgi:hypothetical protein